MIVRVIFLDIDGVLNSNFWNKNHQTEISDGTLIDIEKIRLLSTLVKNTNAKIILHSGWKFWFDSSLHPLRKEADKWIVIDDLDLHNPEIEAHQIKTDPHIGLTMEDVRKAESMLLN